MINITPICKRFGKLPSSFLSKKACRGRTDIKVEQGSLGGTQIPEGLYKEFFMWLSVETRQLIIDGKSTSDIKEYLLKRTPKESQ